VSICDRTLEDVLRLCSCRKCPYSPTKGIGMSWGLVGRGVGAVSKTRKFKEMFEAYFEFPEGWGV